MASSRQIIDSEGNKKFDARVHIRDPKNGKIEKVRPYTLKCVGDSQVYIDKLTGKKYTPDGEEIVEPQLEQAVARPVVPTKQQQQPPAQTPAPAAGKAGGKAPAAGKSAPAKAVAGAKHSQANEIQAGVEGNKSTTQQGTQVQPQDPNLPAVDPNLPADPENPEPTLEDPNHPSAHGL